MFMSPSSVCEATEQPPAHTGMNAQSPQLCHAEMLEPLRGRHPPAFLAAIDVAGREHGITREPGARVGRAIRAHRVGVAFVESRTAPCGRRPRSGSRASWFLRADATAARPRTEQVSQMLEPPEPAAVMHVPFSGLSVTTVSGITPFGTCFSRTTGLKATFTSLSAKSCSLRKSSSAGIALNGVGVEVSADRNANFCRRPSGRFR